jgi:dihydropteroate synthase type 2
MTAAIFGIVNITEDSFSDGGEFLDSAAAIEHGRKQAADGADVLDLGAAASNVDAKPVSPAEEIARLDPVLTALHCEGHKVSIDSFSSEVQRWALSRNADYINDIQGFADAGVYPDLAAGEAMLIVMHSVQGRGRATEIDVPPEAIMARILAFFEARIAALTAAGIARERLILDPGMGFFLSSNPQTSLRVLAGLRELKCAFGLPVLVGVSRKSFLRKITGRSSAAGAATLAAELFAAANGADFIRTHEAGPLRDGLVVWRAATSGNIE